MSKARSPHVVSDKFETSDDLKSTVGEKILYKDMVAPIKTS